MTTDREIARRRLHSQLLAAPAGDAEQVVRTLLGVQAENPSQSAWAVATRTRSPQQADLAGALASGRVLRTHVLRPTWHYVHADDIVWLIDLTAPRVLPVFDQQLGPIGDRLPVLGDAVEEVLGEASDRTRAEVAAALADRGHDLTGQQLMLLLGRLELERRVCSGVPRDGEHTYARFDDRVPAPRLLDRDDALAELARRYFAAHGPATDRDLAYWATLTLTDVRRGIAAAGEALDSFEHDGRTFRHTAGEGPDQWSANQADASGTTGPAGHLLQVLDEMYRGYHDSRWVLDADALLSRARETAIGMALVDGQLVAGMKRTLGARAVTFQITPHRPLTEHETRAIDGAAARYAAFLGLEARVTS